VFCPFSYAFSTDWERQIDDKQPKDDSKLATFGRWVLEKAREIAEKIEKVTMSVLSKNKKDKLTGGADRH
jgi:hypothetical protein